MTNSDSVNSLVGASSEDLQTALPDAPRDETTGTVSRKDRMCMAECMRQMGYPQVADELMALQGMVDKLVPVMSAAVELVCAPDWDADLEEDEELERVLRETGFVSAAPAAGAAA
jgi:hypothetical protein